MCRIPKSGGGRVLARRRLVFGAPESRRPHRNPRLARIVSRLAQPAHLDRGAGALGAADAGYDAGVQVCGQREAAEDGELHHGLHGEVAVGRAPPLPVRYEGIERVGRPVAEDGKYLWEKVPAVISKPRRDHK